MPDSDRSGFRVSEGTLLGSLAALAALGAVVLTVLWIVSMVRGPSTPTRPVGPGGDQISGETGGEGSMPREREPVVETSEVFASRDPFRPLRPGGGRGGAGVAGRPSWAHVVALPRARRDQIEIAIDGRTFRVGPRERFGQYFELLRVSSRCATLLFGDDQFSICEGDRILK